MQIVTVNVGAASPGVSGADVSTGMADWALRAIESRPAVVFAQETSADWLELWRSAGYRVHTATPKYRPVSAVIVDEALSSEALALPTQEYHGSYLAACTVTLDGQALTLVSVHASPSPLSGADLGRWPKHVGRPSPRDGGKYPPGTLFDADFVLATLGGVASRDELIAAGDFNEARGWDSSPGHESERWGALFFEEVRRLGLVDPVNRLWGREKPTRAVAGAPVLQLDHILCTQSLASRVTDAQLDSDREGFRSPSTGVRSDHVPIWATLEPS